MYIVKKISTTYVYSFPSKKNAQFQGKMILNELTNESFFLTLMLRKLDELSPCEDS